jgi:RNA polymerase sigma-70 factor (ECF subfamily)
MTLAEFTARHAERTATLWDGVATRYGVTASDFNARLLDGVRRASDPADEAECEAYLAHLRADELCLAIACERGDEAAWRDFETGYRHGMLQAARALTKDEAESDDLVQSLYGDLYGVRTDGEERLSKFAHYSGRGSLGGWLRAVVYQAFIDRKRQTARFEQVEEADEFERLAARAPHLLGPPGTRPDEIADERLREATEAAIRQAFDALESRDRLLLYHYYFDDLTLREIGRLMGVHEATISRWLQRAQRRARRKTEEVLQRTYGLRRAEVAECLQLAARAEIDVRKLIGETKGAGAERGP